MSINDYNVTAIPDEGGISYTCFTGALRRGVGLSMPSKAHSHPHSQNIRKTDGSSRRHVHLEICNTCLRSVTHVNKEHRMWRPHLHDPLLD